MKRTIDTEVISTEPAPKIDEDLGSIGSVVTIKSSLTQNTDLYAWGPAIKVLDSGKTDDYADHFQCLSVLVDSQDAVDRIVEGGVDMYFGDAGDDERSGHGMRISFSPTQIFMYSDDGEGNVRTVSYYPREEWNLGSQTLSDGAATYNNLKSSPFSYRHIEIALKKSGSSANYVYELPIRYGCQESSMQINSSLLVKYIMTKDMVAINFNGTLPTGYGTIEATLRNY